MEGYLVKQGHVVRNWKKRYFILVGDKLKYFKEKGAKKEAGIIDLVNSAVVPNEGSKRSNFMWTIITKKKKKYPMYSETEEEQAAWFEALSPYCEMRNPSLEKLADSEIDPVDKALSLFEKSIKSKPIDQKGMLKAMNSLLELIEKYESEDPFASNPYSYEDTDREFLLDTFVQFSEGAYDKLLEEDEPGPDFIAMFGKALHLRAAYLHIKWKKWKVEHPQEAGGFLLTAWQDSMSAMTLIGTSPNFVTFTATLCSIIAKESKGESKILSKFAATSADELDLLVPWINGGGAKKVSSFGWVSKGKEGLFKSWKRRFLTIESGKATLYDTPGGKPTLQFSVGGITSIVECKPSKTHRSILEITTKDTKDPIVLGVEFAAWKNYWLRQMPRKIRFSTSH